MARLCIGWIPVPTRMYLRSRGLNKLLTQRIVELMKKIIIATAFLFAFAFAKAQTNAELNTLIKQSFSYFPRIQELQKASETSELRVGLARSNYYPVIAANGNYTYISPLSKVNTQNGELEFQP